MSDQKSNPIAHAYQTLIRGGPTDLMERKKIIISKRVYDILVWHKWAVISLTGSLVLLYLNLSEYAIAGEIGRSAGATSNILGALQLAVKAHEITIVASLYVIARQWIQGSLIDKGLPLGLLGAEKELGQPSFLISKGYLVTVSYVVGLWRRKQGRLDLCLLMIFLFVATVVSSLSGPASGVLMIPRTDWFLDSVVTSTGDPMFNYPYIFVRPKLEYGEDFEMLMDPFAPSLFGTIEPLLRSWLIIAGDNTAFKSLPHAESSYNNILGDSLGGTVNISSKLHRTLDNANNGNTTATTILKFDILKQLEILYTHNSTIEIKHEQAMLRWSARKYVIDGNAMSVKVNCHYRQKEKCLTIAATARCPNLVLLYSRSSDTGGALDLSRVYMTEGTRTPNYTQFTNFYEVIFDRGYAPLGDSPDFLSNETHINIPIPTSNVTVCSILMTMQPVVITSLAAIFKADYVDYPSIEEKTMLFHERWLDGSNWLRVDYPSPPPPQFANGNNSLPARNMSEVTGNILLARVGEVLDQSLDIIHDAFQYPVENYAPIFESIVSGVFLSIYSYLYPSDSQYPNNIFSSLPESLMPEKPFQPPTRPVIITIYNLGYGFRLSSRTGILGITILIAHAVIVVLGSLWQLFWRRSVISAWDTVPDYVVLGLGSEIPPADVLDNTCAGIAAANTLQNIVKVGETTDQHLEIAVGGEQVPWASMRSVLGKFDVKYGSRGGGRKDKLE